MEYLQTDTFFIGTVLVEPLLNQITNVGKPVRIPPKFMQVLLTLAERPGEVITREELLDTVWSDVVVGEAVLTRAISELRKLFDDDPQNPQVIDTILKTGYRLIAPVTAVEPGASGGNLSWQRETMLAGDSMAVAEVVFALSHAEPARSEHKTWYLAGGIGLVVVVGLAAIVVAAGLFRPASPVVPYQIRPLTSYIGEEFDPALSPDGEKVAFAWFRPEVGQVDLYMKDLEGGEPVQLTNDPIFDARPTWSPDGRFLAFVRCNQTEGTASIHTMAATGGGRQKLIDLTVPACMEAPELSWSPDGAWLAYADPPAAQGLARIFLLSTETGEKRQLTTADDNVAEASPVFSPDGRRIAFTRGAGMMGAGLDVYVMSVAGGEATRLTPGSFEIDGLDWTPGGKHIVYASRGNLWKVPVDGGAPQWVTTAGVEIVQPTTARQANRMVYVQSSYEVNIWRMDIPTPPVAEPAVEPVVERLIASTRIDSDPRISPDGQRIAFVSDRDGACGIWISNPDGAQALKLTSLESDCWNVTMLRWSPDGNNIAFVEHQAGPGDIYVVSLAGGRKRQLTDAVTEENAPGWSADGQWVYFSSNRTGASEVWKVPVGGGDPVPVSRDGGFAAFESADGQWVYYTRQGVSGLWRMPVGGGATEQVLTALHPDDATSWRLVPGGIYFVTRKPSPVISFMDFLTQEVRLVAPLPANLFTCSQTDVAPDGQWALFAQVDRGERDIMLVENFR